MATTTNFGWETPDDTDLVKDGAAAIRTALGGVDTSFVDLKGGTTGQVLAKASNTDLDYSWVAVDPLVILDAKGDLITATAADTPARLAVGTNDQVLMADSTAATGLKWGTPASGSMTLLSTTSLSGTTTTISSISGSYKHLYIEIDSYAPQSSGTDNPCYRVNGLSTSIYTSTGGSPQGQARFSQLNIGQTASNSQNFFQQTFWNYANTTTNKAVSGNAAAYEFTTSRYENKVADSGIALTSAINSISIFHGAGASVSLTGTVRIYGVN